MSKEYKSTIRLPQTDFAMKAKLPQREPEMLERWESMRLHERMNAATQGRDTFILHDGPPYANGRVHMGTAMNKMLKDIINRSQRMLGKHVPYVPGWDCHGLPIEWKIEEKYRKEGKNKDDVPINEFRAECREFAAHWLDVQRADFKRLGVDGDWDNPYTTMNFDAEARIVDELLKFLMNGGLYRGSKPVMWSVVEKTALAEAEVEYHDHTSTQIDVRFPITQSPIGDLAGASIVIWTTTPWTLPGNRAIAYGPEMDYAVVEVSEVGEGSNAVPGERLILSPILLADTLARADITGHKIISEFKGAQLEGTICRHPWAGQGYDFDVPLLAGSHVTTETGTGFVHTAPGHGQEDYIVWIANGHKDVPFTVAGNGTFYDDVPLFAGLHVFKADGPVCEALDGAKALLAKGKLTHSYPHSWRSKAPLIFRNTPQWFISMDTNDLRATALEEIERVKWIPAAGHNRIRAMVKSRPDWVVSRQRAWGVPITVFVHKETGEPLRDEAVNRRIAEVVREHGADIWFTEDTGYFLGDAYNADDWEKVTDILDVWFDSGSTHAFVLEDREELRSPADLYLEGSDQHRGWFQSSLLESCGTRGRAPYNAVLTHGFLMDRDGKKMSKSLGNDITPEELTQRIGADVLRLWVVATDYVSDVRIGDEILKGSTDAYRKIRNTLRFLLGNLNEFEESERLPAEQMPELERWVLHRLVGLDASVRASVDTYDFNTLYQTLYNFCTVDLSAYFFDIRKDALYCDAPDTTRRRAARTVLDTVFNCLTAWLAPILCFTSEEAWLCRNPGDDESVHLRTFPDIPQSWHDAALGEKWENIWAVRRVVTGALEIERREKRIGSSLQSAPSIYVSDPGIAAALEGVDLAEISITSSATLFTQAPPGTAFTLEDVPGVGVEHADAEGDKCARCWQILPEVGSHSDDPELCTRCVTAVSG